MQRKVFRIEETYRGEAPASAVPESPDSVQHHLEIMSALAALRTMLASPAAAQSGSPAHPPMQDAEARQLKLELDLIDEAIKRTRQELASLHSERADALLMMRAANELDAVVAGTEQATDQILACAEDIEQMANTLGAALKSEHERELASDIEDRVTRIFEACNFQDLTGQRITKVVATLKFVEEHIARMLAIWNDIERFKRHAPNAAPSNGGSLLNGPKLDGDAGHSSQDDIDAMFRQAPMRLD
jgi:chemotaxis protein CheZ